MDTKKKKQLTDKFRQLAVQHGGNEDLIREELMEEFQPIGLFDGKISAQEHIIRVRSEKKSAKETYLEGVTTKEICRTTFPVGKYTLTLVLYQYTFPKRGLPRVYAMELEKYKSRLELEDITGFLPYGLDVVCLNSEHKPFRRGKLMEVLNVNKPSDKVGVTVDFQGFGFLFLKLDKIVPILRPFQEIFQDGRLKQLFQQVIGRDMNYRCMNDKNYLPHKSVLEIFPNKQVFQREINTYEMSKIIRWCYQDQYDVDNLIGHRLAYDYNQLSAIEWKNAD